MKMCGQIYVKGSVEAFELYKSALNLETGMYCLNEDGTLEHAELKNGDNVIIAIAEDISNLHGGRVQGGKLPVMSFDCWDLGTREAVDQAYGVLIEDARSTENPDGPAPLPWNEYCFYLVDKFGVHWWIAI